MLSEKMKVRLAAAFAGPIRVLGPALAVSVARAKGAAYIVDMLISGTVHDWAREELTANRDEAIAVIQELIDAGPSREGSFEVDDQGDDFDSWTAASG